MSLRFSISVTSFSSLSFILLQLQALALTHLIDVIEDLLDRWSQEKYTYTTSEIDHISHYSPSFSELCQDLLIP